MAISKKGKRILTIVITIVAFILILAVSLTAFAAVKIHSYMEVTALCGQIQAGKDIDTDIADAITAPLFIRPLLNLIEADIDIPLVEACYYNNLQAVEVLLENGADPNFYLDGGWSPMEAAAVGCSRNPEESLTIMKLLYEHGADIDGFGSYGSTALYHVCIGLIGERKNEEQELEILFWLLDNGADPIVAASNTTVLHFAVRSANPELIPVLIEQYGLDVNARGYKQKTPLISAVCYEVDSQDEQITKAIVTELLAHGADASAVDEDGKTAYDYAMEKGYDEVAALLDQE
jgi:hypothetical protein